MTSENETDTDVTGLSGISNFATDVHAVVVEEWHNRTTYGKIRFPAWLLVSVIMWATVLTVIAIVALFSAYVKAMDTSADRAG